MMSINLTEYYSPTIYFHFYDILISDLEMGKEEFLKSIDINPSTYRKCRKGELNIKDEYINKLNQYFGYENISKEQLDELEKLLNDIDNSMYYKICDLYDKYVDYIDKLIEEKYNIYPVLLLFKLLLILNQKKAYEKILENINLYNEIKKFNRFFNESLLEIYELIYLAFEENIVNEKWMKNYTNGKAYYILSFRAYNDKKYIESMFFANKCKEFLSQDGNIIRTIYLNNILMSSLLFVGNYEECNKISFKQLLTLKSINIDNRNLEKNTLKFYITSLFALNKYSKVINEVERTELYNLTTLTCYLLSKYKIYGKEEYCKLYDEIIKNKDNEKHLEYLGVINKYVLKKDKSSLLSIDNNQIAPWLIKILKNIEKF